MTPVEAADKLGVSEQRLRLWEAGDEQPTATAVSNMAGLYGRPLAIFFLAEPPGAEAPPQDFRLRTVGGQPPVVGRDLLVAIRQVRQWQKTFVRLSEVDDSLVSPNRLPQVQLGSPPDAVAETVRALLDVEVAQQLQWRDPLQALSTWREHVEALGVLVFALKLKREVCRGFSLIIDSGPPVIALASESPQARLFTLMHELTHLTLGLDGICTEFEDLTDRGRVESFCNRVAARILMPSDLVQTTVEESFSYVGENWEIENLRSLARWLSVSLPAVALRLEETGIGRSGLYQDIVQRVSQQDVERQSRGGGGQNSWPGVRIAERGTRYSSAIYESWRKTLISKGDAASAMNMKASYVEDIGGSVRRRLARLTR